MALALRDTAGIGPEVVQNLDNPTSIPTGTVRFDSTRHPSGVIQTTNEFSSTIPTSEINPTATTSARSSGDTAIISYTSRTGSLTVTSLLTATGRPSRTVTSHSTVRNSGTSTSTQTSLANETSTAGSGAPRGKVQHMGVVNVMVAALLAVGVFGGMMAL